MVGTYRNFLMNKGKEEVKRRMLMQEAQTNAGEEEHGFTDESLMHFIATAIAYADQELPARNRFIFYRMLLTILDQKLALPQEVVARAMGMHPVSFRCLFTALLLSKRFPWPRLPSLPFSQQRKLSRLWEPGS